MLPIVLCGCSRRYFSVSEKRKFTEYVDVAVDLSSEGAGFESGPQLRPYRLRVFAVFLNTFSNY